MNIFNNTIRSTTLILLAVIVAACPLGYAYPSLQYNGFGLEASSKQIGISYLGVWDLYPMGFYIAGGRGAKGSKHEFYSNIDRTLAEQTFGDAYTGDCSEFSYVDIGVLFKLLEQVETGFGLGFNNYSFFRNYYDPTHILGNGGNYTISDGEKKELSFFIIANVIISEKLSIYLKQQFKSQTEFFFGITYDFMSRNTYSIYD